MTKLEMARHIIKVLWNLTELPPDDGSTLMSQKARKLARGNKEDLQYHYELSRKIKAQREIPTTSRQTA